MVHHCRHGALQFVQVVVAHWSSIGLAGVQGFCIDGVLGDEKNLHGGDYGLACRVGGGG